MHIFNLLEVETDAYSDEYVAEATLISGSNLLIAFDESFTSMNTCSVFFKTINDLKKFSTNLQNAIREIEDAN